MHGRFYIVFFLTILFFPHLGMAQTELVLPLNEDFIPSALNPAELGKISDKNASIAFRNQLQFHQSKRTYTGNLLAWETAVGTHALHNSYWGIHVFSADEPGLNRLKMNGLYAFNTPLSQNISLRLGIQMGYDYQQYSKDYLFPDEITGVADAVEMNSKESLSVAAGGEVEWNKWTFGTAFHQLGNRIGSIRSIYSVGYSDYLRLDSEQGLMSSKVGLYKIDNQNIIKISCALQGVQFGLHLAQSFGLKKSENMSIIGFLYQVENIHFQYNIGYSYLSTKNISSSGFRNEFGVTYSFSY